MWPDRKPLETFLDESAPGVLSAITRNYYNKLSEQLSVVIGKLTELQKNVFDTHDEVHRLLSIHNDSFKVDTDFLQ